MLFDIFENYNLETKHYVILAVLGVVECVLFGLMFYNCFLELRQKRRMRKYEEPPSDHPSDEEKPKGKSTLMEIFSVDMTLNRDRDIMIHQHNNNNIQNHQNHRPSRNSL